LQSGREYEGKKELLTKMLRIFEVMYRFEFLEINLKVFLQEEFFWDCKKRYKLFALIFFELK
jgi:hypothetical protein